MELIKFLQLCTQELYKALLACNTKFSLQDFSLMIWEQPSELNKFRHYFGVTYISNCTLITKQEKINYNLFGRKLLTFLNSNVYISPVIYVEITINNNTNDTLFMLVIVLVIQMWHLKWFDIKATIKGTTMLWGLMSGVMKRTRFWLRHPSLWPRSATSYVVWPQASHTTSLSSAISTPAKYKIEQFTVIV